MNLHTAFIRRIVAAIADNYFDDSARIMVLEGVADVKPGAWSRGSIPNFGAAMKALGLSRTDPWITGRGSTLYSSMRGTALNVLKDKERAEELTQAIFGGLTLNRPGGELYAVGVFIRPEFQAGVAAKKEGAALSAAGQLLSHHTRQKAINKIREFSLEQQRFPTGMVEGLETEEGGIQTAPSAGINSPDAEDAFLQILQGPAKKHVHEWLLDIWSKYMPKGKSMEVLKTRLDNPEMTVRDLAEVVGIDERSVSRLVKRAMELAQKELQRNPPDFLNTEVYLPHATSGMGYQYHMASKKTPAQRIAAYLSYLAK